MNKIEEARELLHNMPELRSHTDKYPANSGELFSGTEFSDLWKPPLARACSSCLSSQELVALLPPQVRVSERNPLDFMPNITHRNKKLFSI